MTLGLFFWPGAAGDTPAELHDLAAMPKVQRWTGRMMPSRPDPGLPDQSYQLLLAHLAAGQAVPPCPAPLRRWVGEALAADDHRQADAANALLLNASDIDPDHEDEFNDWYETEHLPRLRAVDGLHVAVRFRSERDQPRYCALYYLRNLDVLAGAAWREAAATPWTMRIVRIRSDNLRMGFTRR